MDKKDDNELWIKGTNFPYENDSLVV